MKSINGLVSWKESARRREFFERYAKDNNFDPLIPENWYNINFGGFFSLKVLQIIIALLILSFNHLKPIGRTYSIFVS